YVLNVGGSATLLRLEIPYAEEARTQVDDRWRALYGEEFLELPGLRFAFEAPPKSIEMSSAKPVEWVAGIQQLESSPADLFTDLWHAHGSSAALAYAEWGLQHRPDDGELLTAYLDAMLEPRLRARALAFLRRGALVRPVRF